MDHKHKVAGLVMASLMSVAVAQDATYDSRTLVDTNNNSTSTSNVNTTSNTTSTVNSTAANTNTNTNINVNSGTTTVNNVNSGSMTYTNVSDSTSSSTSVNQNTNVNTSTSNSMNTNVNTSTSSSVNTNVNVNDSTSSNTNVNHNVQSGELTNKNVNDTTMRVVQPPPTAVAPAMMSGGNSDLCTTGVSGAVQTQIFGVSSGTTVRDENCERLKLAKTLFDMGMKVAAVATMCQDKRVFDAMLAAGTPCPFDGKIGDQAKTAWESNPDRQPKPQPAVQDETFKKIGIGSILGAVVYKLFSN